MAANKRRAARVEEMRGLLEQWEESDESLAGFARRVGVRAKTLYRWRQRLAAGVEEMGSSQTSGADAVIRPAGTTTFTEVVASPTSPTAVLATYEIVLSGGPTVRVPEHFDPDSLRVLITTLQRC